MSLSLSDAILFGADDNETDAEWRSRAMRALRNLSNTKVDTPPLLSAAPYPTTQALTNPAWKGEDRMERSDRAAAAGPHAAEDLRARLGEVLRAIDATLAGERAAPLGLAGRGVGGAAKDTAGGCMPSRGSGNCDEGGLLNGHARYRAAYAPAHRTAADTAGTVGAVTGARVVSRTSAPPVSAGAGVADRLHTLAQRREALTDLSSFVFSSSGGTTPRPTSSWAAPPPLEAHLSEVPAPVVLGADHRARAADRQRREAVAAVFSTSLSSASAPSVCGAQRKPHYASGVVHSVAHTPSPAATGGCVDHPASDGVPRARGMCGDHTSGLVRSPARLHSGLHHDRRAQLEREAALSDRLVEVLARRRADAIAEMRESRVIDAARAPPLVSRVSAVQNSQGDGDACDRACPRRAAPPEPAAGETNAASSLGSPAGTGVGGGQGGTAVAVAVALQRLGLPAVDVQRVVDALARPSGSGSDRRGVAPDLWATASDELSIPSPELRPPVAAHTSTTTTPLAPAPAPAPAAVVAGGRADTPERQSQLSEVAGGAARADAEWDGDGSGPWSQRDEDGTQRPAPASAAAGAGTTHQTDPYRERGRLPADAVGKSAGPPVEAASRRSPRPRRDGPTAAPSERRPTAVLDEEVTDRASEARDPEYDILPSPPESVAGESPAPAASVSAARAASLRSERLHVSLTRRRRSWDGSLPVPRAEATREGEARRYDQPHGRAPSSSTVSSSAISCASWERSAGDSRAAAVTPELDGELRDVFASARETIFGWGRPRRAGGESGAGVSPPSPPPARRALRTASPAADATRSARSIAGAPHGRPSTARAVHLALAETTLVQAMRIMRERGVVVDVCVQGRHIPCRARLSPNDRELLLLVERVAPAGPPVPVPPGSAPPTTSTTSPRSGARLAARVSPPPHSAGPPHLRAAPPTPAPIPSQYIPIKAGGNRVLWLDVTDPHFTAAPPVRAPGPSRSLSSTTSAGGGLPLTREAWYASSRGVGVVSSARSPPSAAVPRLAMPSRSPPRARPLLQPQPQPLHGPAPPARVTSPPLLRPPFVTPPPAVRGPSLGASTARADPRPTSPPRPRAVWGTSAPPSPRAVRRTRELHHFPLRHARCYLPWAAMGYEGEHAHMARPSGPGSWEEVSGILCGPAAFEVLRRHRCLLFAQLAASDRPLYRLYLVLSEHRRVDSPQEAVLLVLDFRTRQDWATCLIAVQGAGPGVVLSYGRALWMLAVQRLQRARAMLGVNPLAMVCAVGAGRPPREPPTPTANAATGSGGRPRLESGRRGRGSPSEWLRQRLRSRTGPRRRSDEPANAASGASARSPTPATSEERDGSPAAPVALPTCDALSDDSSAPGRSRPQRQWEAVDGARGGGRSRGERSPRPGLGEHRRSGLWARLTHRGRSSSARGSGMGHEGSAESETAAEPTTGRWGRLKVPSFLRPRPSRESST